MNFLSLRRLSAGMFLKIQVDISSQFKWACPKLSCYMRDLVHFACQLNFCLPESYLPVISVRICKNVPARTGPEAGHRPASGLCGSPNLRGACRQGPVCELAQGEGLLLGGSSRLCVKSSGVGRGGYCSLELGPICCFS